MVSGEFSNGSFRGGAGGKFEEKLEPLSKKPLEVMQVGALEKES